MAILDTACLQSADSLCTGPFKVYKCDFFNDVYVAYCYCVLFHVIQRVEEKARRFIYLEGNSVYLDEGAS